MAISFVSAGTEGSGSSGTTVSPGLPSGIQANDILICAAACWDGTRIGSMDGSWTRIVENSEGTSYCSMAVFWHRYDGSNNPSTTVTFASSSGDGKVAGICAFRGCITSGSPINAQSTDNNGTSTTTITHNSVTTNVDGAMLVMINGTDENDTRSGLSSGFTNIFEDTAAGTDNAFRQTETSIHASYKDQGTQGSTGSLTVSGSGLGGWCSVTIALAPAATNKVLTADAGSYSITGTAASLKFGRKLAANAGSYSISGTAATLRIGKKLSAEAGSYSISGTNANFVRTRKLIADTGTYLLTGTSASLELGRKLTAETVSYLINGTDASFVRSRKLIAETGSYNISGTNANFTRTYILVAGAGSYTISGTTASLLFNRLLSAGAGSYSITGTDATLVKSGTQKVLNAEAGSYAVSGTVAGLLFGRILVCSSGVYNITGYDATLTVTTPSPHKGKRRIKGRVVRISSYNAARGKVV